MELRVIKREVSALLLILELGINLIIRLVIIRVNTSLKYISKLKK